MKLRNLIILIISLAVLALAGWLLFFRDKSVPLVQTISNILPFGSGGDNTPFSPGNTDTANGTSTSADEFGEPSASLFRLAVEPVAGAVAFNLSSSTSAVRYVDRATGHIFEVALPTLNTSAALDKKKISNKTLPKIYEAYFRPDGQAVLLRSLRNDSDTVDNLSLTLTAPKGTSTDGIYTVTAAALRGDIGSVAVGTGNTLFYSLKDSGVVVSSAFNSTGVKTLFSNAFTEWRLSAAGSNLFLYTKASSQVPGYAYSLNSAGSLAKVLGPLNGLAVLPDPTGARVLYSYMESGAAKSAVRNLQTGANIDILPVTLAEKCVWSLKHKGIVYCGSPEGGIGANEPDNWYGGVTHFSDRLWQFDTSAEVAQVLAEPKASLALDLDVYMPMLSPKEDYLIFMNKTDLSLWALRLSQF